VDEQRNGRAGRRTSLFVAKRWFSAGLGAQEGNYLQGFSSMSRAGDVIIKSRRAWASMATFRQ
jgi:hypothetical protein